MKYSEADSSQRHIFLYRLHQHKADVFRSHLSVSCLVFFFFPTDPNSDRLIKRCYYWFSLNSKSQVFISWKYFIASDILEIFKNYLFSVMGGLFILWHLIPNQYYVHTHNYLHTYRDTNTPFSILSSNLCLLFFSKRKMRKSVASVKKQYQLRNSNSVFPYHWKHKKETDTPRKRNDVGFRREREKKRPAFPSVWLLQ